MANLHDPLRRAGTRALTQPGAKWTPETGWTDEPLPCRECGVEGNHLAICSAADPEAEPTGDLPGMAGWWSGGIAGTH